MSSRTIFITSFNPFVSRNILRTDAFNILKNEGNLTIVIFCPDYKKDFFQDNFAGGNVIVEGIEKLPYCAQDVFFSYLGRSMVNTDTLSMHKREIFLRNKKKISAVAASIISIANRFSFIKKLVRIIDYFTISQPKLKKYFDFYNPNLVFTTDVFNTYDVHFLAEAKKRGITTVGMVRSWDNITSKGLFRVRPDALVVNNEIIKNEAMHYNGIKSSQIIVVGMPQYDAYFSPRSSHSKFCEELGLDPQKKIIFFSPAGRRFYDSDGEVLTVLQKAIRSKKLNNVQVLTRFPPNDDVNLEGFTTSPEFYFDIPGYQFVAGVFKDKELTKEDSDRLADILFHSDVVINYCSTIGIDAAVFDKPFITIAFDAGQMEPKPYLKSSRRFLDYEHVKRFLDTGAPKIVRSEDELIAEINFCLENPRADSEKRKKLLRDQVWRPDGQAGKRLAVFLLNCLDRNCFPAMVLDSAMKKNLKNVS